MKAQSFTPDDLEPILRIASDCGMVLVGGQAVNSWAVLLEKPEQEPWKSLRPYTSQDADMLCSEIQMLRFAKALSESGWKIEVFKPEGKETRINVGAIRIQGTIRGKKRSVDMNLLRHLEGTSNQEIEEFKEEIPIRGQRIKIIDCLRLLESKTISLNTLDQNKRQDGKHLKLCCAALKRILQETDKSPNPEGNLATAKRIVQNAESQLGMDTRQHHGIDLLETIPWLEWKTSKHPELEAFAKTEETIRAGIQSKTEETNELKQWMRSLNPKPAKETPTDPE